MNSSVNAGAKAFDAFNSAAGLFMANWPVIFSLPGTVCNVNSCELPVQSIARR